MLNIVIVNLVEQLNRTIRFITLGSKFRNDAIARGIYNGKPVCPRHLNIDRSH